MVERAGHLSERSINQDRCGASHMASPLCYCTRMELRFDLRAKRKCQKCAKENFITSCNYVKKRDLAFENIGRKCVKISQKVFAIQKFLLPLHPIN